MRYRTKHRLPVIHHRSKIHVALVVGVVAIAALLVAAPAASAATCNTWQPASQSAWTWGYTGFAFTDVSVWDAGNPYDGSRFDSSWVATWSAHSNGGSMSFDNGTFSPYRNTGLYNNGSAQTYPTALQANENGSCF